MRKRRKRLQPPVHFEEDQNDSLFQGRGGEEGWFRGGNGPMYLRPDFANDSWLRAPVIGNCTRIVRNFHAKQTWSLILCLLQDHNTNASLFCTPFTWNIIHPIYLEFEAESIDVPAESLLDLIGCDIFWIDLLEQRVWKTLLLGLSPEWDILQSLDNLTKGAATSGTQPPPQEQDSSQPLPGLTWLGRPQTILRGRAESRTWSSNSPRPWKSSGDQWWLICWEKLMCRDAKYFEKDPFLNSRTPTWHSLASVFHFMSFRQWHLPWEKNMRS